jgi:hypothetical protein
VNQTRSDIRRYRTNYIKEQDGIALYRALARAEKDPHRTEIFEKLAAAEEVHAARWAKLLTDSGAPVPHYRPSFRVKLLGWLSRSVGTQQVLPVVSGFESRDQGAYVGQVEATGLPAAERSHSRTLQLMLKENATAGAESIVKTERWHRTSFGGSLRAAVFGVNDGLVSNFSLVMGIAGTDAEPRFVLLAGVAGLLAGAFSMAAGEYVSVRSQRELYEQQLALEAQELEASPEEEHEELSLIYQAKGVPSDQARVLAEQILSNPDTAIDTLAREELGLDPAALGSPTMDGCAEFVCSFRHRRCASGGPLFPCERPERTARQYSGLWDGAVPRRRPDFHLYRPQHALQRRAHGRYRRRRRNSHVSGGQTAGRGG